MAAAATSWLLEKQPHLSQLLLYVDRPPSRVAFHVGERLITLRIAADAAHPADEPETISIPLDCSLRTASSSDPSPSSTSSPSPSTTPASPTLSVHKAVSSCLLKLPMVTAPPSTDDSSAASFPLAAELRPSSYPALRCRRCCSALLRAKPEVCLPLPSTFWSELVDLWYCHTEGNAKLDRLSASNVSVGQGRMLVGVEELRVAIDDVHQDSVDIAEEWREEKRERMRGHCPHPHHQHRHEEAKDAAPPASPPVEEGKEHPEAEAEAEGRTQHEGEGALLPSIIYRRAHCARCRCELGSAVSFSSPPSSSSPSTSAPPAVELHLLKHRITDVAATAQTKDADIAEQLTSLSLQPSSSSPAAAAPSLLLSHYTLETHLTSHLLALCHARCSFRFVLRTSQPHSSTSANPPTILLTLLNLDTSIQHSLLTLSTSSSPPKPTSHMQPVLKVAYEVVREEGGEKKGGPRSMQKKGAGEAVGFSEEDMEAIEALLAANSALLPADFAAMGKQRLSFLRQLSEVQW